MHVDPASPLTALIAVCLPIGNRWKEKEFRGFFRSGRQGQRVSTDCRNFAHANQKLFDFWSLKRPRTAERTFMQLSYVRVNLTQQILKCCQLWEELTWTCPLAEGAWLKSCYCCWITFHSFKLNVSHVWIHCEEHVFIPFSAADRKYNSPVPTLSHYMLWIRLCSFCGSFNVQI